MHQCFKTEWRHFICQYKECSAIGEIQRQFVLPEILFAKYSLPFLSATSMRPAVSPLTGDTWQSTRANSNECHG
jgi:hypothetical protein